VDRGIGFDAVSKKNVPAYAWNVSIVYTE